jgi:ribosomal-protein-serine acetyltransferase
MRTEIYGSQIVLKAYEMSFIPMLFEAAIEARSGGEFTRWMPWCHENYTMEESRTFVEKTVENWHHSEDVWRPDREFGYAIFDSKAEKFLGGIGLNQPNAGHKFYNLGYWVRPSAQNRGIASRATRLLANAAFEDLPLNRIEILAAVENIPSRKAAEKAGAHYEGVLRKRLVIGGRIHDAALFSFIREDFQN